MTRASDPGRAPQAFDELGLRLLASAVELIVGRGYPQASVLDIARAAGVSRAAFYARFSTKSECLDAAYARTVRNLLGAVDEAVGLGEPDRALQSAVGALADFAAREPDGFAFLTHQALLAGRRGIERRDRLVRDLQEAVERSWARSPEGVPIVDVSPQMLLEGTIRLLNLRLRRAGVVEDGVLAELRGWVDSYAVPARRPRWRGLTPEVSLLDAPQGHRAPFTAPRPLPRVAARAGRETLGSIQREHLLLACAVCIKRRGLLETTVADITAEAGVSRDAFYSHFADRHQALQATMQLVFERIFTALASAFFVDARGWPDRVWSAGEALADFVDRNEALAHCIVEGTNAPRPLIEPVDGFAEAFTIFLDGGYVLAGEPGRVGPIVPQALVGTVLETVSYLVRRGRGSELHGFVAPLVYTVLVPYVGCDRAEALVEDRLGALSDADAGRDETTRRQLAAPLRSASRTGAVAAG